VGGVVIPARRGWTLVRAHKAAGVDRPVPGAARTVS
jgi:hypothetical protein